MEDTSTATVIFRSCRDDQACLPADREFFDYLSEHIKDVLAVKDEVCRHIAEKNCEIKYQVVMKDERESGLREVLNLGHTVGRAIETVSDYKLLHGEAVAIGLVAEVKMAEHFGYCTAEDEAAMVAMLKQADLPTEIPDYIDRDALVKKLYTDKKVRDGHLRFVLQHGIGAIEVFDGDQYAKGHTGESGKRDYYGDVGIKFQEDIKLDKKIISTEKAPQAIGPYSQAIVANGFLFTSGMVPIDPATNQLVEGDITVQAKQAISNLKNLIEASGSSCDKVVKTTVFIKDMNQFSIINDIYKEYFNKDFPARSCVEVARLPKDVLIEIEAVAVV